MQHPEKNDADNSLRFDLPATLTIDTVESVAANILSLPLAQGKSLVLDASKTEIVTTPGAQLIFAISRTLKDLGGTLTVEQLNAGIAQAFEDLGLGASLAAWGASK